jgi:hypothetical protein
VVPDAAFNKDVIHLYGRHKFLIAEKTREGETKMAKGKAFLLVGHAHWGKSKTLTALTDGNWNVRYITIKGVEFKIKRSSNSDNLEPCLEFVKNVTYPNLIIAFSSDGPEERQILEILKRKYDLYFFVLQHKYNNPDSEISEAENKLLEAYSNSIESYTPKHEPAEKRATAFRAYIKSKLP